MTRNRGAEPEVDRKLEEDIATMGFKTGFRGVAALVGMIQGQERDDLVERVAHNRLTHNGQRSSRREIALASDWAELQASAARLNPRTIIFDDSILPAGVSLEEATRRLAAFAPVTVVAPSEKQSQLISLLGTGEIDFVAHSEEFISVAAALAESRLRRQPAELEFRSAWTADLPADFAEILRHEINNPLTGILGNAELLLSQLRGNLTPVSVQRLETVVDLAVRLRETIRCLSSEWERQHSSLHSA